MVSEQTGQSTSGGYKQDGLFAVALVGSGGAGVMTAAEMLLKAGAREGWYGLLTKSFGPQIRGGEAAAFVTLSTHPIEIQPERFDVLFAVDWQNADRFAAEIPLDGDSLIVSGLPGKEIPDAITVSGAKTTSLDLKAMGKDLKGARPNMIALGVVAKLSGVSRDAISTAVEERIGRKKGAEAVEQSLIGIDAGIKTAADLPSMPCLPPPVDKGVERMLMTGNQATGLGALRGGIQFVAAYPITPATDILEWMAPRIRDAGGQLEQAEDELAAINMIIGASYGGTPSLTATSGPGLALMIESIGLAVAAEVPIVVVDVQRGGPSTGIPTKAEQSDFNIAVHGLSGDAPHIVVAPTSIADCIFTTQWAVHLAESMQVPVILLSDQSLGQGMAVVDQPADLSFATRRAVPERLEENYHRYAVTADGISPMSLPGMAGGQYTADGLEHTPRGTPSAAAEDHAEQLNKRLRKIAQFDYGQHWADVEGDGDIAVITWGVASRAVQSAIHLLGDTNSRIRLITLRLLAPASPEKLAAALEGTSQTLVVELNHGGQLYRDLKASWNLDAKAETMHRPGPRLIRPGELIEKLRELTQ